MIDKYNYKLDLENGVLILKLGEGYEAKLRLLVSDDRIKEFIGWSNYEIVVKFDGGKRKSIGLNHFSFVYIQ